MGILSESSAQLGRSSVACDLLSNTNMSDLPALHLFEEIQGLSNSTDFYCYNKEDPNKTWSLYDEDCCLDSKTSTFWNSTNTQNNNNSSSFSGKSSPTRDTWDPMLYNINLTTYLELNMDEDVQVRQQPVLETPITPLPGVEDLHVFLSFSQSLSEHARVRQNSVKEQEVRQHLHYLERTEDRDLS